MENMEDLEDRVHEIDSISMEDMEDLEDKVQEIDSIDEDGHSIVPSIGLVVDSIDDSYNFYNRYALHTGFSIKKMQRRFDKMQNPTVVNYGCSKQGFRTISQASGEKKYEKSDTRTGCLASIRFQRYEDCWKCTQFNEEHNHELARAEERRFLRSGRKISDAQKGVLHTMAEAGMRTTQMFSYMAKESGGFANVGFTRKDCYNFLNIQRLQLVEAGDAQGLVNHFRRRQEEDPMFFYSFQMDQEDRMTNIFWRDGRARLDYDSFGDVIVFDTTYRTNKYNMICAPFVGVNSHWNNVLFGCAFFLDETIASFVWLFETFLESMGFRQPKTIFTDQDQAMARAIAMVFTESRHRLCIWHISKNATQHLSSLYANSDFKKQFQKCLHWSGSEEEFEANWDAMVNEFGLQDHRWLKQLYDLRAKWCPSFSLKIFSAGIRSSQRSESTNNVFHNMATKTMHLTKSVIHYELIADKMREVELEEDFRCHQGKPARASRGGPMLIQAAEVYTRKMYKIFEQELTSFFTLLVSKECHEQNLQIYELVEHGHKRIYKVVFTSSDVIISCSCCMFESLGILCRHALRVLVMKNVNMLPPHYILHRWTKNAKNGVMKYNSYAENMDKKLIIQLRRNEMMRAAYRVVSMAAKTDCSSDFLKQKISECEDFIIQQLACMTLGDRTAFGDDKFCGFKETSSQTPILDPPCVRPKGVSNARLKNPLEKRKKKKSKEATTSSKITVQPTLTPPIPAPTFQAYDPILLNTTNNQAFSTSFGYGNTSFTPFTALQQSTIQIPQLVQGSSSALGNATSKVTEATTSEGANATSWDLNSYS